MSPEIPLPPPRRPVVEPLAAGQYRVQFTVDEDTRKDLRMAQDLLRHRIPDGDLVEVVKLAIRALLDDLAKQKYAAVSGRRTSGGGEARDRTATSDGAAESAPGRSRQRRKILTSTGYATMIRCHQGGRHHGKRPGYRTVLVSKRVEHPAGSSRRDRLLRPPSSP